MKKQKLFLVFTFLCVLSGCSKADTVEIKPVQYRVVEQIDISCCRSGVRQYFSYSTPQKMETILTYLRQLEYRGMAETDPERIRGDSYQITVRSSDGTFRRYRQRADCYLSRNNLPWEKIDTKQAQKLYPLLQEMPSDNA